MPAFHFSVDVKHFEKGASSWKRWHHDTPVISLTEFSSNTNRKWPVIVAFLNSSGAVWTEDIWYVFRMKLPLLNSSGVMWKGPQCFSVGLDEYTITINLTNNVRSQRALCFALRTGQITFTLYLADILTALFWPCLEFVLSYPRQACHKLVYHKPNKLG